MLMDLFYETIPPHIKRKRRVHFHAFMIDVHKRMHAAKARLGYQGGDVIGPVARELANEAYILCFDEFQVRCLVDVRCLGCEWYSLGHGYRRCHDLETTLRTPAELRRCLCHDIQVSSIPVYILH